jgi:hypothetical protein
MHIVFEERPVMTLRRHSRSVFTALAIICVWSLIVLSQNRLTRTRLDYYAPSSMAYVPQTEKIKPFLMGFSSVYADYLWIRTTLYFGSHFMTDRQYPWLVHMVDFVTRLNPNFYPAYEFAGLMIPDVCHDPDAARVILERGISSNLEKKWKLLYYLGMVYYLYYDDKKSAASCFARAATLQNAPVYKLAGIAATMFKKAGAPEEGREFLEFIFVTSENPEVKRYIGDKLRVFSNQ